MLKKIVGIRNVGRFINSADGGDTGLTKQTMVLGHNGHGKTTLCAILRSLQTGVPGHVIGRKRLGSADPISVEILLDGGMAKFEGAAWSKVVPEIAIFDGTFVGENIYSGEAVELGQKRNLYRVIIGQEGHHLAEEEARINAEIKAKNSEITLVAKGLQGYLPRGMTLERFIDLPNDPNVDSEIQQQERTVEALKLVNEIQTRPTLQEFTIPVVADPIPLLARTLEQVADGAEQELAAHFAAHGMTTDGQPWVVKGLSFGDGTTCPYCGQGTKNLSLLAAYKAVFSATYSALKADVIQAAATLESALGEENLGRLMTLAEQNRANAEFWGRYCTFDAAALSLPVNLPLAIRAFRQSLVGLLRQKSHSPLEVVTPDEAYWAAIGDFEAVQAAAENVNGAIRAINAQIAAKKAETAGASYNAAVLALELMKATKKRHEPDIAAQCGQHNKLKAEKDGLDKAKDAVRRKLEDHTAKVVKPYEERINHFLSEFNAGFTIAQTRHTYTGGIATSQYQIVINETPVDLGDGSTAVDQPSFKNTLSAGDKTTLALAFFLAHLERDPRRKDKIVIFDDPFSSQDAFRRNQTALEIRRVGQTCAQVIVLSHDAHFLYQVWEKVPPGERKALQIFDARANGCKIRHLDLEAACKGRIAKEVDALQTYYSFGEGEPHDVIKKMRVVLETYCRTSFPAHFSDEEYLGHIVGKIRETGPDHPAYPHHPDLEAINEYTSSHHHGTDVGGAPDDEINPQELAGHVKKTLKIVNALQA